MQTLHLRAARYSLYVLFPCLALHFVNEHVIGGDTPCFLFLCLVKLYRILVIPLEDLPELQVGYGFGLVDKENVPKPDFLKVRNKDNYY